jgi:hypothetical protein
MVGVLSDSLDGRNLSTGLEVLAASRIFLTRRELEGWWYMAVGRPVAEQKLQP